MGNGAGAMRRETISGAAGTGETGDCAPVCEGGARHVHIGNGYRSTNLKFKSDDEIQTRRIKSFDRHMEPADEPVLEGPLDRGVLRTTGGQYFLEIEAMTEGMGILDENQVLTHANESLCRMLGYKKAELVGRPVTDLLDGIERLIFESQMYERKLDVSKSYGLELRARDGRRVFTRISPRALFDPLGRIIGSIAVVVDISERVLAEVEVREKERSYNTLASNVPCVVYCRSLTPTGKTRFFNEMTLATTGYAADELECAESTPMERIILPEDRNRAVAQIRNAVKQNRPFVVTYRIQAKDGGIRYLREQGVRVRGAQGSPAHVEGMIIDISEHNRPMQPQQESELAQEALSTQLEAAREEERSRIARELHDGIGQNLAGIQLRMETACAMIRAGQNELTTEYLNSLIESIRSTSDDVRRISSCLWPQVLDDLGLLAAISFCAREFQAACPDIAIKTDIRVNENDIPRPLKIVMYRIIQEALHNVTDHAAADFVRIRLAKSADGITLAISDNGCGFSIDRIRSRKGSRRGFGLKCMERRAVQSGGKLTIRSVSGGGALIRARWEGIAADR